eukprot:14739743-Alexandrium_andersonii.AAC.1
MLKTQCWLALLGFAVVARLSRLHHRLTPWRNTAGPEHSSRACNALNPGRPLWKVSGRRATARLCPGAPNSPALRPQRPRG